MRYDKASLQAKLRQSPAWRRRALLWLYAQQTELEQERNATIESNARGFGETDAKVMSAAARLAQRGTLTRGMDIMLQQRLPKYWRQIVEAIAAAQAPRLIRAGKSFVEITDHG